MSKAVDYVESKWVKGDVISSARLNNIEKGILNLTTEINRLEDKLGPSAQDGPTEDMPAEGFDSEDQHLISVQAIADARGAKNGLAPLNDDCIIPSEYLPSYVDDVLVFENYASFPQPPTDINPDDGHAPEGPETGKIYIAADTGYTYRWYEDKIEGTIVNGYALIGVADLDYNDNNEDANNGTAAEGTSFGAENTKFVSSVLQNDGKIKVIHRDFAPHIAYVSGTANTAPNFKITIAGNDSAETPSLNMATADNKEEGTAQTYGIYGVTRLSNIPSASEAGLAATPKGVQNAINLLDYPTAVTPATNQYISEISQVDGVIVPVRSAMGVAITSTSDISNTNVSITVGTESKNTDLPKASVGENGVYGVTKLSNAVNSDAENIAATPKAVKTITDRIAGLDFSDTGDNGASDAKYIKKVTQTDGQINVEHAAFNPSISWVAATTETGENKSDKPRLTISIGGNPATSNEPNVASLTVYGVAKLSNTAGNDETLAATPKGVQNAISAIKGQNNGLAELDANGHVPSAQLPSYVDDVIEVNDFSALPVTGEDGKIYVDISTNVSYRWSGTQYTKIASDLGIGETSSTAGRGDWCKTAYDHAQAKGDAYNSDLYKITTNAEGHVTSATTATVEDILALKDANNHYINDWEDITEQCIPHIAGAKVVINRALKIGHFNCKSSVGTNNATTLIQLPSFIGTMKDGEYFNSRMDGSMLVSAEIPEKSKTITQVHSANTASSKAFNASGWFMYRDPVYHTLTINYTGEGNSLIPYVNNEAEEYMEYTHVNPIVDYCDASEPTSIVKMDDTDKIVTVNYTRRNHDVTINYVNTNNTAIHAADVVSKPAGLSYTITPVSVTGYTPQTQSITATLLDENVSQTFIYNKINNLTITYTSADTISLPENISTTKIEGEAYSYTSPTITGYTPDIAIVSGTAQTSDINVTVTYIKDE